MTTDDPIQAYQAAMTTVTQARRKAEGFAQFIVDVGTKLQRWEEASFANIDIGFPIGHLYSIDAKGWPTARDVAQAIADYHTAVNDMENAWRRIPESRRIGMTPPPRFLR